MNDQKTPPNVVNPETAVDGGPGRLPALHIIHHNDMDGRCAAVIAAYAAAADYPPDTPLKYYETNYNRPADVSHMKPGDTVIIVDFSYPPEEMEKIEKAINYYLAQPVDPGLKGDIIWIDHHATASRYGYTYPGLLDFADKGPAACELTWLYFFDEKPMPKGVALLGDYDSWRLALPKSIIFNEGAKLLLPTPQAAPWLGVLQDDVQILSMIETAGEIALAYRNIYAENMRNSYGYETTLDGHQAYALNVYGFGSQGFGKIFNLYSLVIAYIHDGRNFTVSLYSRSIDVSEIAKTFGGGGHKGAAGFVCAELPWISLNAEKEEVK